MTSKESSSFLGCVKVGLMFVKLNGDRLSVIEIKAESEIGVLDLLALCLSVSWVLLV